MWSNLDSCLDQLLGLWSEKLEAILLFGMIVRRVNICTEKCNHRLTVDNFHLTRTFGLLEERTVDNRVYGVSAVRWPPSSESPSAKSVVPVSMLQ